ncbi:hypothetical protein PY365_29605 [Roseiarcaceae bacterium H3SJ34-1]|uniref:hypothetical protein n=1 Tax=Terripilifer ovatus TaxID=3032367 RepID=UPI003AB94E75|nr:hypothetical protein [Roseiarcaceae bacterium H3SJ34-1]
MKRAVGYAVIALLGVPLALPANAGFLDFLFQAPAPTGRYPGGQAYESRLPDESDRHEMRRIRRDAERQQELSDQQTIRNNRANVKKYQDIAKNEGVKAALFKDHTLRRGDILVTPEGMVVYDGRKGRFQPLEQSSLKNRADLQNVAIALPTD